MFKRSLPFVLLAAQTLLLGTCMAARAQVADAELRADLGADYIDAVMHGQPLLARDLAAVLANGFPGAHVCLNVPMPAIAGTEQICHTAYTALYDAKRKVPRLVVYELTGAHTLGCVPRATGFHSEGDSAKASAYDGTGYDLGHMDPAQDNAWDEAVSKDSFSMVNVAPQLPGLNRQEWERLEEDVRAWALQRGKLLVYVGPIFSAHDTTINGVEVPAAFFKIVEDEQTGDVLAFDMPQEAIAKGDVTPYRVSVSELRAATGIQFAITQDVKAPLWPADLAAWHKAHKAACGN